MKRGGKRREEEERRKEEEERKGGNVRLFAYVPPSHLGSNLGPHSTQEGETPRTQQSLVLDSGAPATDKESAKDRIEMRQTVAQSHINEREKGTVRGGREEEKVWRGGVEDGI